MSGIPDALIMWLISVDIMQILDTFHNNFIHPNSMKQKR